MIYLTSVNSAETAVSSKEIDSFIEGIARGEKEAFEALYNSARVSVYAFALSFFTIVLSAFGLPPRHIVHLESLWLGY